MCVLFTRVKENNTLGAEQTHQVPSFPPVFSNRLGVGEGSSWTLVVRADSSSKIALWPIPYNHFIISTALPQVRARTPCIHPARLPLLSLQLPGR